MVRKPQPSDPPPGYTLNVVKQVELVGANQAVRNGTGSVTISGLPPDMFHVGDKLAIAGMTDPTFDTAFNQTFPVVSVTATSITYAQAGPASTSGGAVISAPATVVALDPPYIQTQASIVFIGACDNNPYFEQLWNITDTAQNRALIVPKLNYETVYLGQALVAWREIARSLAAGNDVNTAVNNGNTKVMNTNFVPRPVVTMQWMVIGGKDANGKYIGLH